MFTSAVAMLLRLRISSSVPAKCAGSESPSAAAMTA